VLVVVLWDRGALANPVNRYQAGVGGRLPAIRANLRVRCGKPLPWERAAARYRDVIPERHFAFVRRGMTGTAANGN